MCPPQSREESNLQLTAHPVFMADRTGRPPGERTYLPPSFFRER
jgi:hypothetical protein